MGRECADHKKRVGALHAHPLQQNNRMKNHDKFINWISLYNPGFITARVLSILLVKYEQGDKDSLFAKMLQLEQGEHYEICAAFGSMFAYMGINTEYLEWRDGAKTKKPPS